MYGMLIRLNLKQASEELLLFQSLSVKYQFATF